MSVVLKEKRKEEEDRDEAIKKSPKLLEERIEELRRLLEIIREAVKSPNGLTSLDDLKRVADEIKELVRPLRLDEDDNEFLKSLLKSTPDKPKQDGTFLRVEESLEIKGKTIGGLDSTKTELQQVELVVKEGRQEIPKADTEIKEVLGKIAEGLEELRKKIEGFYPEVEKLEAVHALERVKEAAEALQWAIFHDLRARSFGDEPRAVKNNYAFVA